MRGINLQRLLTVEVLSVLAPSYFRRREAIVLVPVQIPHDAFRPGFEDDVARSVRGGHEVLPVGRRQQRQDRERDVFVETLGAGRSAVQGHFALRVPISQIKVRQVRRSAHVAAESVAVVQETHGFDGSVEMQGF